MKGREGEERGGGVEGRGGRGGGEGVERGRRGGGGEMGSGRRGGVSERTWRGTRKWMEGKRW